MQSRRDSYSRMQINLERNSEQLMMKIINPNIYLSMHVNLHLFSIIGTQGMIKSPWDIIIFVEAGQCHHLHPTVPTTNKKHQKPFTEGTILIV